MFFAFQLTEFTVNDRAEELIGSDCVNAIYSIGILCTASGFVLFSYLRHIFVSETGRKVAVCIVCGLSLIAAICVILCDNPSLFLAGSFLALLSFGCIGGNVYYNAAMIFQGSLFTGRTIGIAAGVAVMAQFAVQNLFVTEIAFIVGIALSVGLLICFVVHPPKDWMFENPLPYSTDNNTDKKTAFTLVMAVLLMSLVVALIDGVVVSLHALGAVSVSSWTRLFYAAGLVTAGFIADIRQRRYLAFITVCVMFVSTISTAFLSNAGTFTLSVVFMYLYCGFYVGFLTVSFLDFAPKTKNPALWAGMGRIIRGVVVAATAIPTAQIFRYLGSSVLVTGSCIFAVAALLVLFREIGSSILQRSDDVVANAAVSEAERIKLFAAHYKFTPRETEVFETLITGSESIQEIADAFYISRRVLQRYITSIYEKTGTNSRLALFQKYTKEQN